MATCRYFDELTSCVDATRLCGATKREAHKMKEKKIYAMAQVGDRGNSDDMSKW